MHSILFVKDANPKKFYVFGHFPKISRRKIMMIHNNNLLHSKNAWIANLSQMSFITKIKNNYSVDFYPFILKFFVTLKYLFSDTRYSIFVNLAFGSASLLTLLYPSNTSNSWFPAKSDIYFSIQELTLVYSFDAN